ncbi:ABC transporter permease [Luteimonas huabeiensis]|uniref:ABC transporter permease n=1 Tax=Luteimonas huabeiensis TaxID=1244513 RepID=UPI0004679326|nr:ABC transporter permease [Luteimonas huabeiensis]
MSLDTRRPRAPAQRLHAFAMELRCEGMRLWREPMYVLPTLLLPVAFYAMFGLLLGGRGDGGAARYLLATYGVFGTMAASMFGFGVTVAIDRERGFLALRRALPASPAGWMLARMLMAMLFAAAIALLLGLLAAGFGGVRLAASQWLLLAAVQVLGALPCCAIGLYLGALCSANAAPAVVNLLFLPMAFLSGLWLPLSMLPDALERIAPVWPSWHLAQLALAAIDDAPADGVWMHLLVLAVVAACCFVLAMRRLARVG